MYSSSEPQQPQREVLKSVKDEENSVKSNSNAVDAGNCFVCQGSGHWARECTSLPSMYLTEDAPRCYRCNGLGHFARFCPTSEKQWRNRVRRASSATSSVVPKIWGFPYIATNEYAMYPDQISDQLLLVRPDYSYMVDENALPTPDPNLNPQNCRYTESEHHEGDEDDVSVVEYTIVDNLNAFDFDETSPNMIESSVETA